MLAKNTLSMLYFILEECMQIQYQETMTLDEKLAIGCKSAELRKAGDEESANRLLRTAPLPPYIAKVIKEKVGLDYLINSGWNLSEAELAFGSNWLSK
ncbi:MAG: hypothetical protein LBC80_03690 [Treponema sp.]|nr:hypothetical protein [Treponema sp.]